MKMDCFSKVSVWLIFALVIIRGGKAALLQECANDETCKATDGDPNAVCSMDTEAGGDANGKCICSGSFKKHDTNDECIAKGNGDTCSADSDCMAVTNSACESDMTCGCADGYKIFSLNCSAVLDATCAAETAAADCTDHLENSACIDDECTCAAGYLKAGAKCSAESSAGSVRLSVSVVAFSGFTAMIVAHLG